MPTSVDLGGLRQTDLEHKPLHGNDEWRELLAYYEDRGRELARQRNNELGVGVDDSRRPLMVAVLRRLINRISTVYARPPTRWLRMPTGDRIPETSPDHEVMIETLARMQMDLCWRRADRLRSLLGQVVIRYFPNPHTGAVMGRIFTPDMVMREPDAGLPDTLELDKRFALALSGDIFEYWERTQDGWVPWWVDKSGAILEEQPAEFATAEQGMNTNPYGMLVAQMVHDDYPGGRVWISPRESRLAFTETINALGGDIHNLVIHQSHTETYFKTDEQANVPKKSGPGIRAAIPPDTEIETVAPNPRIRESQGVLEGFLHLWSVMEEVPAAEFDRAARVLTGALLRVAEKPLRERREAQVPLASMDELRSWEKIRAVHNFHRVAWGREFLRPDLALDVEIADMETPIDDREMLEGSSRAMALGAESPIDLIQRREQVPRHTAIEIYKRVKSDMEEYPPAVRQGSEQPGVRNDGPQIVDLSRESERSDMARDEEDSVVQALEN